MTQLTARPPTPTARPTGRTVARWMVSFAGFPLGGVRRHAAHRPRRQPGQRLAGGLITGTVLGAVQAWAPRPTAGSSPPGSSPPRVGLSVGLAVGAALVGYATGLGDLAVQGAVSGPAVGLAQAVVLRPRIGRVAFAWPVHLAATWAAGWTITTAIGVQVDEQFTVFGSTGAIVVTALTAVLPVPASTAPTGSAA